MTVPLARELPRVLDPWSKRYANEPFIELVEEPPELRHVAHRNVARIAVMPVAHVRTPTLLVFSAIDNLMKGAAGQAVQNANLMLGWTRRWASRVERQRPMMRVVKIGGRAQGDARLGPALAAAARAAGSSTVSLCVVHGGGDEVSALQRRLGLEPVFSGGRRVTSEADLEIVRMVLSGP